MQNIQQTEQKNKLKYYRYCIKSLKEYTGTGQFF